MPGQFYFSLLNPAIAITFAIVFLLIWRRFSEQLHLLIAASAFLFGALAFVALDFGVFGDAVASKLVSNLAFVTCVALACASGLARVGQRVPWRAMVVAGAIGFAIFCYYLFVTPSTIVRVVVLGMTMAAFALMTIIPLLRSRPLKLGGKLITVAACIGFALAIARPVLALSGLLPIDDAPEFQHTTYWVTVQAFTPLLTGTVGLLFLAAMSIETFEQLRAEANHDYLTGLLNRRGFEAAVSAALAADEDGPALLMADIDDFKKINDSFGHKVGDQVIAGVARVLSSHGNGVFAARVGGEEFALYYHGVDSAALQRHAETIKSAVSRLSAAGLPAGYPLTLSIGLHARIPGETLSEMLIEADRALYKAKTSGKDRAVLSPVSLRPVERQARRA